jgi:hypothetical protein
MAPVSVYACEFKWADCEIEAVFALPIEDDPYQEEYDKSIWLNDSEYTIAKEDWVDLMNDGGRGTHKNSFAIVRELIEYETDGVLTLFRASGKFYVVPRCETAGVVINSNPGDITALNDTLNDTMVAFQRRPAEPRHLMLEMDP